MHDVAVAGLMAPTGTEMAMRLVGAFILGAAVGAEREVDAQTAGVRTHAILAVGAALVMCVALHLNATTGGASDPSRIPAQVLSGIGFLGAGAILRFGTNVRGLTTAATLWTVAGIGLAAGAGYWAEALVATGLTLAGLTVVERLIRRSRFGRDYRRLHVIATARESLDVEVRMAMDACGAYCHTAAIRADVAAGTIEYEFSLRMPDGSEPTRLLGPLQRIAGIRTISLE